MWLKIATVKRILSLSGKCRAGQQRRSGIQPEQPETVAAGAARPAPERVQPGAAPAGRLRLGQGPQESGDEAPEPLSPVLLQPDQLLQEIRWACSLLRRFFSPPTTYMM